LYEEIFVLVGEERHLTAC